MKIFTAHPHSVGESYWQHLAMASRFGARLVSAGAACFVHGLFPFWCKSTGSTAVRALYKDMGPGRERFDGGAPRGVQNDWCI